jgi:hypothetical protein
MSKSEVNGPASSAPTDRLALGVGWVRPGVAGIGGTLNPSDAYGTLRGECFEGNEE